MVLVAHDEDPQEEASCTLTLTLHVARCWYRYGLHG
jgi:hypothetical protein